MQYFEARAALMTGPQATPPRASTVRRMVRLIAADGPRHKGALIKDKYGEGYIHPTKGFRA